MEAANTVADELCGIIMRILKDKERLGLKPVRVYSSSRTEDDTLFYWRLTRDGAWELEERHNCFNYDDVTATLIGPKGVRGGATGISGFLPFAEFIKAYGGPTLWLTRIRDNFVELNR